MWAQTEVLLAFKQLITLGDCHRHGSVLESHPRALLAQDREQRWEGDARTWLPRPPWHTGGLGQKRSAPPDPWMPRQHLGWGGGGPSEAVLPWVGLQTCSYREPLLIAYFQWWPSQPDPNMKNGLPAVASTQNGPLPAPPQAALRFFGLPRSRRGLCPPAHCPQGQGLPGTMTKGIPPQLQTPNPW